MKYVIAMQGAIQRVARRYTAAPLDTPPVWHNAGELPGGAILPAAARSPTKIGDAITASPIRTTVTISPLDQKKSMPPRAMSFCFAEFPFQASALVSMYSPTRVTLFVRL